MELVAKVLKLLLFQTMSCANILYETKINIHPISMVRVYIGLGLFILCIDYNVNIRTKLLACSPMYIIARHIFLHWMISCYNIIADGIWIGYFLHGNCVSHRKFSTNQS